MSKFSGPSSIWNEETDPAKRVTVKFDTYAFLPANDRSGMWQRYTLEMTVAQVREAENRIADLETEANNTGQSASLRRYERSLVKRFR